MERTNLMLFDGAQYSSKKNNTVYKFFITLQE
jgi:hypothetical protein